MVLNVSKSHAVYKSSPNCGCLMVGGGETNFNAENSEKLRSGQGVRGISLGVRSAKTSTKLNTRTDSRFDSRACSSMNDYPCV